MIKKLVTTLETSRKLSEAGIKIDSHFYWFKYSLGNNKWALFDKQTVRVMPPPTESYPAPLAEEIIPMLPIFIKVNNNNDKRFLDIDRPANDIFIISYIPQYEFLGKGEPAISSEFLSEACSLTLLELVKKGLK